MQMAPCCPPSMPNIADNLSGLYLLTGGDAEGRTVGVQSFQSAAVVDLDIVTVAAAPAVKAVGNGDSSICGGKDGCALGASNVGAGVGADFAGDGVYAVSELRGNGTCNRQRPLQGAGRGAGAVGVHKFSTALCKTAEQFRPQFLVLRVLQELQIVVLAGGKVIICRHFARRFVGKMYYKDGFGYGCGGF